MGSKALVLVDRMYVELPHALIDREDVVYFDSLNKSSLVDTVRYYLEHEAEARRIAMNGYYKVQRGRGVLGERALECVWSSVAQIFHSIPIQAIRYHRYVNRVDFILNSVNLLTDPSYQVSTHSWLHPHDFKHDSTLSHTTCAHSFIHPNSTRPCASRSG